MKENTPEDKKNDHPLLWSRNLPKRERQMVLWLVLAILLIGFFILVS